MFKINDKVVCINNDNLRINGRYCSSSKLLKINEIYTVSNISNDYISLKEITNYDYYYYLRFKNISLLEYRKLKIDKLKIKCLTI